MTDTDVKESHELGQSDSGDGEEAGQLIVDTPGPVQSWSSITLSARNITVNESFLLA